MSINYAKSLRFKPYKKKITFEKNGFPLNFHEIAGNRWQHMQDILRLPNHNGKQYYIGTYSQNVAGGKVSNAGEVITDDCEDEGGMVFVAEVKAGESKGKVIWVDVLSNKHKAGGFNHPGDIRLIDNVVVIAGQNWDGGDWIRTDSIKSFFEGLASKTGQQFGDAMKEGNGGNAVLFYDVSNPTKPSYMGKLDSYRRSNKWHYIKNDIDKVQILKRRDGYYYLYTNAIDGEKGWKLRSRTLYPDANWEWVEDTKKTTSRPSIHYYNDDGQYCSALVNIVKEGRETAWLEYQTPDESFRNDYERIPKTSFGSGTTMNISTMSNGANVLVYGNVESDGKIEIEEVHGIEHNHPIYRLYIYERGSDSRVPDGYEMLPLDLNKDAGGKDIFLCYTRDPNKSSTGLPITGLKVTYNDKDCPSGYRSYVLNTAPDVNGPYDLNRGAGGDDIYLWYSRNPSGNPIYSIDVTDKAKTSVEDKRGWERLDADLNKGSNGSSDLYIIYSKFELT